MSKGIRSRTILNVEWACVSDPAPIVLAIADEHDYGRH